ncbi:MAG TPA: 23S rRNA (uracil(1939)-C(5))-methyltransferase RlmD [Gammaproteobacteria bacterium]|nr:23S rRNA (uracil(1939)-C(5))-methyltransferase RlmD [Gammaproteobacteria bacterium]
MGRRYRRKKIPQGEFEAEIESLSQDGRGVTHIEGKAVFIDGALPGEKITFTYTGTSRKHDDACIANVLIASEDRVEPRCSSFNRCGGCSLQHLDPQKQIEFKQQSMLDGLERIGKVKPENVLDPLRAEIWGYRRKARLGVRYVRKKERVLVGFREKRNSFITDIESCPVLFPAVGEKLTELGELIKSLEARASIPQIEVSVTDRSTVLVFRHLEPLCDADKEKLLAFGKQSEFELFLQSGGPDTVVPLGEVTLPLQYEHPQFDITVNFSPLDFTQVNDQINQKMVAKAIEFVELEKSDSVLDLFCGLGNFTLPIARHVKEVVGVEADKAMLERAHENAKSNGLSNTKYYAANLMGELEHEPWLKQQWDKILLDPPRSGAKEVIEHFHKLNAKIIVYISCHPGTLARDAGELVHTHGYQLIHAGVMDMFPHTAHVESIAVFKKS